MSVLLLRHMSAGHRERWDDDDKLRPLDKRGRKQARALTELFVPRSIGRIVSSPYRRCVESVEALADARGLPIELDERLAEGVPTHLTLGLLAELDDGLACTHGDVIEAVVGFELRKGAAIVIDVAPTGVTVLEKLRAP
jgi:phosphohistidine phosphatase SixA